LKTTIEKIETLAKANRYGTVEGCHMNGTTAREIIAIVNHPKFQRVMITRKIDWTNLKSHELMDLTIRLPKLLNIKIDR
tara:strand:+ start:375 stop:611 length:237 start_codon:yes stop_codon:yes gene_type:complete